MDPRLHRLLLLYLKGLAQMRWGRLQEYQTALQITRAWNRQQNEF